MDPVLGERGPLTINPKRLTTIPIVAADDDPVSLTLISRFMAKIELRNEILTASDGDAAMALLKALVEQDRIPALILLDHHMPGITGLELLKWTKEQPSLRHVPTLMLTGSSDSEEIESAYALGVSSYLVKPVGFDALVDVVRGLGTPWALLPPDGDIKRL